MIRSVRQSDAAQIVEIYNHYISNSIATFEEEPVTCEEISKRIDKVLDDGLPWLVLENEGKIIGYAYASRWHERVAYRNTVESTVYLDSTSHSKGWGLILYQELLKILKEKKIHVVLGGISLPNTPSVCLHENCGFEKVAHFKEVGYKFDAWVDVGYWQLKLND